MYPANVTFNDDDDIE